MNKIQIYSKGYCPFCKATKATLQSLGLPFEEYDITHNDKFKQEMYARSQRRTVPQIFINNHHVGGNDDFQTALRNGKLKAILKVKSAA